MAVTKRTRFEVLKRDNYTCRYCRSAEESLTIDHVTPVALGGSDSAENLVAACSDCNSGKSSTAPDASLVNEVSDDHIKWGHAMRRAAEIQAESLVEVDEYIAEFDQIWDDRWSTPWNYESSLKALFNSGLPLDQMREAAYVTIDARGVLTRFNYFCGVAYRKLNKLQEIAAGLVDEGGHIEGRDA